MKIIYTVDLHGSKWKYERLYKAAKSFDAKVVINGGDMLPKEGNLFKQNIFIVEYLDDHFAQFESAGIYYLCYLGNDDLKIFDELFESTCKKYTRIIPMAQRRQTIGDYEFIGFNLVVDYPFRLKDRCRKDTNDIALPVQYGTALLSSKDGWQEINDWEGYTNSLPTIEDELNRLVRPKDISHCIYVIHMPPYKLGLDKCHNSNEVGSKAVYEFLKQHQPLLSLHGHIHESPEVSGKWHTRLGETICIQPGQMGEFTYVVIDLDTIEIKRIKE